RARSRLRAVALVPRYTPPGARSRRLRHARRFARYDASDHPRRDPGRWAASASGRLLAAAVDDRRLPRIRVERWICGRMALELQWHRRVRTSAGGASPGVRKAPPGHRESFSARAVG